MIVVRYGATNIDFQKSHQANPDERPLEYDLT